tara:strand:+ start:402 stop:599 length:198 start_codon:yes stop_codon:yes gene_type:complete
VLVEQVMQMTVVRLVLELEQEVLVAAAVQPGLVVVLVVLGRLIQEAVAVVEVVIIPMVVQVALAS